MSRHYAHFPFVGLILSALVGQADGGSITFDPSFSKAPLSGPAYTIDASNGRLKGGNLWFGFGAFGLMPTETATFTGPNTVTNIIGTVGGSSSSMIAGTITSTAMPKASLFLLNPNGVVLTSTASVNVGGGFHASTADYLKLSDGTQLRVASPGGSTLTAAAPAAFGFLASHPQAVSVTGTNLGLTGGNLSLIGGGVTVASATLKAQAGTINLVSVASAGEVPIGPTAASSAPVTQYGPVWISGGSLVSVQNLSGSPTAGSVFVRGNTITVDASQIDGNNNGSGGGGIVALTADAGITFSNGAQLYSVNSSTGAGADIQMTSNHGTVLLDGRGTGSLFVAAVTQGNGPGGRLDVTTANLEILGNAYFVSRTAGAGQAGALDITATDGILLSDPGSSSGSASILSSTSGSGAAGPLSVTAGVLTLAGSASILTTTFSSRVASDLSVTAGSITLSSGATQASGATQLAAIGSAAPALVGGGTGAVSVTAGTLTILPNGEIGTNTRSDGNGGAVTISVAGTLDIVGLAGTTSQIPSGIFTNNNSGSQGSGGSVQVVAGTIEMTNLAEIQTVSSAGGNGGNILILARDLFVTNSDIAASGDSGGNVTIAAAERLVFDKSVVSANGSAGNGGNLLFASDSISVDSGSVSSARAGSEATGGVSGSVLFAGLLPEVTGTVAVRASDLVPKSDVRQHGCAPRQGFDKSSLLRPSPGRLRHDPGAPTASVYLADQPPQRDAATKAAAHALPARPDLRPLAECG